MGKPKMWKSRKRLKRSKPGRQFGTRGPTVHNMEGTFDTRFLEFGLGSFGAICKLSNSTIFKNLLLSEFSSDSSKLYKGILIIQAVTFWRSAKNCKNYGIMAQDHMQLEVSKCYFSHNCHWSPSKFLTTLVTMLNLNAC